MSLASYPFSSLNTFSRASAKTYTGSSGMWAQQAAGAPAFNFDPVALTVRGLSLEESATNIIFPSDAPGGAFTSLSSVALTAGAATGPDGIANLAKLVPANGTTGTTFYAGCTKTISGLQIFSFSIVLKAGEYKYAQIGIFDITTLGNSIVAKVDLNAGTIVGVNNGTGIFASVKLTNLGNGLYRASITGQPTTNTSSANIQARVYACSNSSYVGFTGDGTSGIYFGYADLVVSSTQTSHILTTAAAATRAADVNIIPTTSPATWFANPVQGSFYHKVWMRQAAPTGKKQTLLHIDDGTANNVLEIRNPAGTSNIEVLIVSGGTTVWQQVIGTFTAPGFVTACVAYAANNFIGCVSGGAAVSSTSGNAPVGLANVYEGCDSATGTNSLNGDSYELKYMTAPLGASDLVAWSLT